MITFFIRSPSALIWSGTETLMWVCINECGMCVCVCVCVCIWVQVIVYIYMICNLQIPFHFVNVVRLTLLTSPHPPSSLTIHTHTLSLSLVWCRVWPHIFVIKFFMINEWVCMCYWVWCACVHRCDCVCMVHNLQIPFHFGNICEYLLSQYFHINSFFVLSVYECA